MWDSFIKRKFFIPCGVFPHVAIFCVVFSLSQLYSMKMLYCVVDHIYFILSLFSCIYQKIKVKNVPQWKYVLKFYMLLNNCCVLSVSLLLVTSPW